MNNLINIELITINNKQANGVSSRELHKFLDVQSKFQDWIKNRISKYEFVENQDFVALSKFLENGGRTIEYYITLDMAKELAMVENNEKGKQARKYFLECEKRLKSNIQVPTTFKEALLLAVKQQEKLEEQTKLISEYQPKVSYYDQVMQSKALVCIKQIAQDYGKSAILMNNILNSLHIQYKTNGQWILFSKYVDEGYVHSKTIKARNKVVMHTQWTQKGKLFLYEKLKQNGILPVIEQNQSIPTKYIQLPKLQHVNGQGV